MNLTWWHALPIGVAAVASFMLGGLWYSPLLFGRAWANAHGYTAETLTSMRQSAGRAYLISFVGQVATSAVLHLLLVTIGVHTVAYGVMWGAIVWAGFAAPIGLSGNVFSRTSHRVFVIDAGYQLAYLMLMGAILGPWH